MKSKIKGDSAHIQKGNPSGMRPDNKIIARIQENLSVNTWEEEAIGQHVKTNGKPKGISHLTRIPIVDSTPVQQIHPEIKCQRDLSHIDTDEKVFLLMQGSYPSTYNDYDITNHSEKMAISILKTAIVSKLKRV